MITPSEGTGGHEFDRAASSLPRVRLTATQREELVSHAREDAPNECCGYGVGSNGAVEAVVRSRNLRDSRYGYELDGPSLLAANEADDEGREVFIYHSHPRSPAEPSQTDVNLAQYPHWLYVIVSLAAEPDVRAWRIADGRVEEEPIELV